MKQFIFYRKVLKRKTLITHETRYQSPDGPLLLADFVGLDTLLSILQILHRELGDDKYRPCPLLIKHVEAGWYGKKAGRGFYEYGAR